MSIIDVLIYAIDWILQNALLPILPSGSGDFDLVKLQTNLDSFKDVLVGTFSGFGAFFPMNLFLLLIFVVLWSEFGLFLFHIVMKVLKWAHLIG